MSRSIYLDFGANEGDTIAAHLSSHETNFCWGFEPNPRLAARLRERFKDAPVEIVEAAAWTSDTVLPLYLGHPLSSTLMTGKVPLENYPQFVIDYSEWVNVAAIDTARWIRAHLSEKDVIIAKMDIEGAEYEVLPSLLESGVVDLLTELRCEFHPERFPQHARQHDELLRQLEAKTRLIHWA